MRHDPDKTARDAFRLAAKLNQQTARIAGRRAERERREDPAVATDPIVRRCERGFALARSAKADLDLPGYSAALQETAAAIRDLAAELRKPLVS